MTMPDDARLHKLAEIAELALDAKLARLRAAATAKADTAAQIANLGSAAAVLDGGDAISCALSQLSHQRWIDARHLQLNLTLARQTAAWMEATDAARKAFGKKTALAQVIARR